MTATDEKRHALKSPPIPAIVFGLVHAVAGGVLTLLLVAYGAFVAYVWASTIVVGYSVLQTGSEFLGRAERYLFLFLFGLALLAACTLTSGLWLLRGHPRGRRWTVVLACVGIPYASVLIAWTLTNASQFGARNAASMRNVELGFMAYWLFALIVMYLPNVRRFYAPPQPTSGPEDSTP